MNNKQFESLFGMMCHLASGTGENYKLGDVELSTKDVKVLAGRQIQAFMLNHGTEFNGRQIQAFGGSSEVAEITANSWNATQATPNYDTLWSQAFRRVPLSKGQLRWDIGNVTAGTAYKKLTEGQKVEFEGISGSKVTVTVDLYGAGLEITWQTYEGRDLAAFFNAMTDFTAKRQQLYADVHYGLLATAGATNQITWQGASTDTNLVRDIATLNLGAYSLGNANKDKGYGDTANANFIIYANPKLRGRINAAIKAGNSDLVNSGNQATAVDFNITPAYSFNSSIPANKGLIVLPGNKIQNSMYMNEKAIERIDQDNLAWVKSSFTAFGAAVGDNDQVYELAFA